MRGLRLEGKGHGDDDLNHSSYFLFASSSDIPLPSAHLVLNSSRRLASSSLNHLSSSKSSSREVHVTIFPSGSILQYLSCLQLPVIPTISDLSPPHIQTFIKSPELSITQLNFFSASKTSLSYSSPRPFGHVLQYSHCFLRSSSWRLRSNSAWRSRSNSACRRANSSSFAASCCRASSASLLGSTNKFSAAALLARSFSFASALAAMRSRH